MLVEKMKYFSVLIICLYVYHCTALPPISHPNAPNPVSLVYVFPKGVWVENIAFRPNGQLLITRLDTSELYLFDFASPAPEPILVYRFPNALALTGIAEVAPDVFAVSVGNYTLASGPTAGSWAVWRMDLSGWSNETLPLADSQVSKIADVTEAAHLKDMWYLSEMYILLSDFRAGVIYRLDMETGAYTTVIANSLTAAVPQKNFSTAGVSGLHVRDDYLYFTNTGLNIFARIPIDADGTPAGSASIVAHTPASTDYFDGFTFGANGDAYMVTGSGNTAVRLSQSDGSFVTIAGRLNSTLVAEPTACAFGRGVSDQGVLYVTTAGGLAAPVSGRYMRGGSVVVVEDAEPRHTASERVSGLF